MIGVSAALFLIPVSLFEHVIAATSSPILRTTVAIGMIAFAVLGIVVLKSAGEAQNGLDRNLLDAFLEHIPDNVYFKDRESRFLCMSNAMAK